MCRLFYRIERKTSYSSYWGRGMQKHRFIVTRIFKVNKVTGWRTVVLSYVIEEGLQEVDGYVWPWLVKRWIGMSKGDTFLNKNILRV